MPHFIRRQTLAIFEGSGVIFGYGGIRTCASIHLAFALHLCVVNDKWIMAEGHETSKEVANN